MLGDTREVGAAAAGPVCLGRAAFLPDGFRLLVHLGVEVEGGELRALGEAGQLSEGQRQGLVAHRAGLVDVDGDGARVTPLGAGGQRSPLGVDVDGVDVGPGGGSGAALGHAAELLEDGAPVDLVGDHGAQLASHGGTDRTPLALGIGLFDRFLQRLFDLALDEFFFFLRHFAPAFVAVEAMALALGLFLGLLVLHDLGEVPLL